MADQKISIYDPGIDAYREVSLEVAQKFVDASKVVEAKLAELQGE